MKKETILVMAAMCVAGLTLATGAARAQAVVVDPVAGGITKYLGTISAVREVAPGNPLPGLHLAVKVEGKKLDVYIAPMNFVTKYEVKFAPGDLVRFTGTTVKSGSADVVLAFEITSGVAAAQTGRFLALSTFYLRNEAGPMWTDEAKPASAEVAAH